MSARIRFAFSVLFSLGLSLAVLPSLTAGAAQQQPEKLTAEQELLKDIRQLTLVGKRAGEGYFSPNGRMMIFQSEREPNNPFYQMYLLNLDTGDINRVSPGHGKTTCGWLHPKQRKALFASTHEDPQAGAKMSAELAQRKAGNSRRYSWSFDEAYDIYSVDLNNGKYSNLTNAPGYDAEGAYSPDGRQIVFASNRAAYGRKLSAEEQALFDKDKSGFMDLYIMDADGSNIRRLTNAPGYDGGPFFSADGRKIVWRRFSMDGRVAEIHTMNVDGSGASQVTKLGHMAWAPFFHPSGDYIIFASNRYGSRNFELFIIDSEGKHKPVRVTESKGFDGLPVFTPDGNSLAWTSGRTADGKSQIFMAGWNDARARELLGIGKTLQGKTSAEEEVVCGVCKARLLHLRWHVATLTAPEMMGRLTGTEGARRATQYVAQVFRLMGLKPGGDNDSFFQSFDFTSGVSLGKNNKLTIIDASKLSEAKLDGNWRPLSFSLSGAQQAAPVVFAGFGIEAPASNGKPAVNAYDGVDVKGKWVLMFRGLPANIKPEERLRLSHYADLHYKAASAKAKGALGIIVAPAPGVKYKEELIKLSLDAASGETSLAGLSVDQKLFAQLTAPFGKGFGQVFKALDEGDKMRAIDIPGMMISANLDIKQQQKTGRNVIALLKSANGAGRPPLVIGAHVDHLGRGNVSGSLAKEGERGQIHFGADDNASGVAALLEIAEGLAGLQKRGHLNLQRDILFTVWSGEELGLIGSRHFVDNWSKQSGAKQLTEQFAAYLNMDMIGRMRDKLTLFGTGSSSVWRHIIERANIASGLRLKLVEDGYVPSDATSFYLKGVPVLHAYTGEHADYSTPRDTADKLNYQGLAKITTLMDGIAKQLARAQRSPDYIKQVTPRRRSARRRAGVYLGSIPEYGARNIKGVKLSGVIKGGPAEQAGLKAGDVIVRLADMPLENIYDYVRVLNMLKAGKAVSAQIQRDGKLETLSLTPAVRE